MDDNVLKLTIEKNGEKNTYEVDLKNVIELCKNTWSIYDGSWSEWGSKKESLIEI